MSAFSIFKKKMNGLTRFSRNLDFFCRCKPMVCKMCYQSEDDQGNTDIVQGMHHRCRPESVMERCEGLGHHSISMVYVCMNGEGIIEELNVCRPLPHNYHIHLMCELYTTLMSGSSEESDLALIRWHFLAGKRIETAFGNLVNKIPLKTRVLKALASISNPDDIKVDSSSTQAEILKIVIATDNIPYARCASPESVEILLATGNLDISSSDGRFYRHKLIDAMLLVDDLDETIPILLSYGADPEACKRVMGCVGGAMCNQDTYNLLRNKTYIRLFDMIHFDIRRGEILESIDIMKNEIAQVRNEISI